ncbi:MAG: hypothetical protein K8S23_09770 [Candidatus Cloacimonetes bacterium]|nr:hypothetical protein [Candidatus Cloacimonadota bacterium]
MKKIIIIVVLLIFGKSQYAINSEKTLYSKTISAFQIIMDETSEQNEKYQAQKEYMKCILELSQNNDGKAIKKILDDYWINVSIENNKNDWQTKTLFQFTIRQLFSEKFSNKTKKEFLYLEKFIFNPHFFEYGKKAIFSEITHSELYENEPDYIFDLIIRMLEDVASSTNLKRRVLQLGSKRIIDDEWFTIVSDKLGESQHFKDILFSYIQDKGCDMRLRTYALMKIASSDSEKCEYKDILIKYIDDPTEPTLNTTALRAVQSYKDYVLTQRAIDYLYNIIEEETGNEFVKDYSLFYSCNLTKHNVDGVNLIMRSIVKSGTDNVVSFFSKIIYAGIKLDLQKNKGNLRYLTECIELIGKTKNPKAIPVLVDIYDNHSFFIKRGNVENDRLKKAALVGFSFFEKDEIQEILESRYGEYNNNIHNKRAKERIEAILRD